MSDPVPSRISKIVDWLYDEIKAALPESLELLDPNDLFENPPNILARGWGVSIEQGENTERCLDDQSYYYRRLFTMVLSKDYVAMDSDPDTKRAKQKALLEDLNLLLKRLTGQNSIEDSTGTTSFIVRFEGDSGPRPITVNGQDFLFIELTVSAEYRELA